LVWRSVSDAVESRLASRAEILCKRTEGKKQTMPGRNFALQMVRGMPLPGVGGKILVSLPYFRVGVTRQQQQRYLCAKSAVSAKAIGSNAKQDANASQIIRRGVPFGTDIFLTAKPTTSDRSADTSGAIKTAIPS
jgi:hypothetical protein